MAHYSDDASSDTSLEAIKESSSFASSGISPSWVSRFGILRPLRRRYAVTTVLALIAMGSVSMAWMSQLDPRVFERVNGHGSTQVPLPLATLSALPVPQPMNVVHAGFTEDMLPAHLKPAAVLQGSGVTGHFRGTCSSFHQYLCHLILLTDSLRNDTGYMTSYLSAGWSEFFPPSCDASHSLNRLLQLTTRLRL